jgi:hypothetical protein
VRVFCATKILFLFLTLFSKNHISVSVLTTPINFLVNVQIGV